VIQGLLYEASRTAGAAMVLTALGCICTGLIAYMTRHMPGDERSEAAFKLAKVLAVFGGGCAIVGGLTGLPYHWLVGDVGFDGFAITEAGLVVLCGVWALVSLKLVSRGRVRSR
jgi:hypothetical protein